MSTRVVRGLVVGWALAVCCAPAVPCLAAAEPPPAGHDIGVPPLDSWKGDLAIWTGVVFLLVLAVLWKFAWGPIIRGLNRREQGIAGQLAQAEQSYQKAQALLAEYQQKLADSQQEVRGILEQGRRGAEQVGQELLEKAKQEAQAEQQQALEQIGVATADAMKQLAAHGAELAVELAGKIVRAELKPDDHAVLIQQTMANFARRTSSDN